MKRHILMFVAVSGLIFLGVQCLNQGNINNLSGVLNAGIPSSWDHNWTSKFSESDTSYANFLDMDEVSNSIFASGATSGKEIYSQVVRIDKSSGSVKEIIKFPYPEYALASTARLSDSLTKDLVDASLGFNYPIVGVDNETVIVGYSARPDGSDRPDWKAGICRLAMQSDGTFKRETLYEDRNVPAISYVAKLFKGGEKKVYAIIVEYSSATNEELLDGNKFYSINGPFKFALKLLVYNGDKFGEPVVLNKPSSSDQEYVSFPHSFIYNGKLNVICNYENRLNRATGQVWVITVDTHSDQSKLSLIKSNFRVWSADQIRGKWFLGGIQIIPIVSSFVMFDVEKGLVDYEELGKTGRDGIGTVSTMILYDSKTDPKSSERVSIHRFKATGQNNYYWGIKNYLDNKCESIYPSRGRCEDLKTFYTSYLPDVHIVRNLPIHPTFRVEASVYTLFEDIVQYDQSNSINLGGISFYSKLSIWGVSERGDISIPHTSLFRSSGAATGSVDTIISSKQVIVNGKTVFIGTSNRDIKHLSLDSNQRKNSPSWCELIKITNK